MSSHRWILIAAWLWVGGASPGLPAEASAVATPAARHIIDVWDTAKGLPQNSVIAMVQSQDGYLWLGTLKGLVRFDGVRFEVFNENNTPGLNSSRVVALFEDRRANLWVGTESEGVALIRNGRITSLDIGRGSREGRLMSACEDRTGAVWLYTADGQLCRYQDGRISVAPPVSGASSGCRCVVAEESGYVWVGANWGQFAINPAAVSTLAAPSAEQVFRAGERLDFLLASRQGGYWRLADGRIQLWRTNTLERDLGPYPWSNVLVSAACEDREGHLIVGTRGDGAIRLSGDGVYWFDATGHFTHINQRAGLSDDTVFSLCVDREGSLWVGTDLGGLNRIQPSVFEVVPETQGRTVQSVCEDGQGGLWIGFSGGGLMHWRDRRLQDFGLAQGLNPNVSAVLVDRSRRVWVGAWHAFGPRLSRGQDGLFGPAPGSEAITNDVLAIHQDRSGRLWVGTQGGLARWDDRDWRQFNTRDGLTADQVTAIADDVEGNLWVGTDRGGLNRSRDDRFTAIRKAPAGLPSNNISSLLAEADGVLWIGTDGGGLVRHQAGRWTQYTTREGLSSDSIGYLIDDSRGDLWMGSITGLMRAPKKALNAFANGQADTIICHVYGEADGLPTGECTVGSQPAAARTPDGRLWFPTIKGLVSVDPARLTFNTNPPPVVIESVQIEGREQNTNGLPGAQLQAVTVPADKEWLEIRYASLNLGTAHQARFKYRMEGHEAGWRDAGRDRVAAYSKLPAGPYRFHVVACNEDGVWNEAGATLSIVVLPPFWRTWWFLGATAIFTLALVVSVVHYISTQKLQRQLETFRQQEALEAERARIARDIHDQLGASLTQVSLLGDLVESDKNLPAEVETHARQISQTARETTRALDEIVWTVNPSNDTLEGLINYVCKYAQDYLAVAGLRYRLDVPAQLPATAIPPEVRHNVFLAAKEAITNVVRHAQATEVRLRLKIGSDGFTLEIEDDGRGLGDREEKAAPPRNGLRNMRRRMEDVGGRFSIGPAAPRGTRVGLTVPFPHR